jgi:hypothetical protein
LAALRLQILVGGSGDLMSVRNAAWSCSFALTSKIQLQGVLTHMGWQLFPLARLATIELTSKCLAFMFGQAAPSCSVIIIISISSKQKVSTNC